MEPASECPPAASTSVVPALAFYRTYHGHSVEHLRLLHAHLPQPHRVWLVGDSSLDNKFWLLDTAAPLPAENGLAALLAPPLSYPDIAHHLNALLARARLPFAALNAAVEESALCERARGRMLPQDALVAEAARPGDVVVACCGGNDVVLKPSLALVAALAALLACASQAALAAGTATGLAHFVDLFCAQYGAFLRRVCARAPSLCVVCMVYYPLEAVPGSGASWADASLALLGYSRAPEALQRVMRAVFEHAVRRIALPPGTRLAPLALYDVLDARCPGDYVQRVEPSAQGGLKIARAIVQLVAAEQLQQQQGAGSEGAGPPEA